MRSGSLPTGKAAAASSDPYQYIDAPPGRQYNSQKNARRWHVADRASQRKRLSGRRGWQPSRNPRMLTGFSARSSRARWRDLRWLRPGGDPRRCTGSTRPSGGRRAGSPTAELRSSPLVDRVAGPGRPGKPRPAVPGRRGRRMLRAAGRPRRGARSTGAARWPTIRTFRGRGGALDRHGLERGGAGDQRHRNLDCLPAQPSASIATSTSSPATPT